jgi:uncharacterized membrane protein YhfC
LSLAFDPLVAVGLGVSAVVSGAGPLVLAVLFRKKTGVAFKYFAMGALVFVVSQCVLRLPWQVPLAIWIAPKLKGHTLLGLAFVAFSALGAGVFEEVGRYVGYKRFIKDERTWRVGVMYGIGHGGVEAMLLAGLPLMGTLVVYLLLAAHVPLPLSADAMAKLEEGLGKLTVGGSVAGGVERVLAVTLHVGLSLLVLQAFTRGKRRWLAYAIGLHFLSDSVGVVGAHWLMKHAGGPLAGELAIVPFAAIALWIILSTPRNRTGGRGGVQPQARSTGEQAMGQVP